MAVAAVFQLFDGLQGVTTGALRGLSDTHTPMIWNLVGHWGIGLPTAYWLCFHRGWGVQGLWAGLCVGIILIGSVLLWTWHKRSTAAAARFPRI
jgi:multidrug resistance protein, MATE family